MSDDDLRPLFDVTIHVFGDNVTGSGVYDVEIVDRCALRADDIAALVRTIDDAIAFAKGAVTAFMQGTEGD